MSATELLEAAEQLQRGRIAGQEPAQPRISKSEIAVPTAAPSPEVWKDALDAVVDLRDALVAARQADGGSPPTDPKEELAIATYAKLVAEGSFTYSDAHDSLIRAHLLRTGDVDFDTEERLGRRLSDTADRIMAEKEKPVQNSAPKQDRLREKQGPSMSA
jgi:hypothetical protein